MIRTIAKKEVVEALRDGRFRWAAGLVGVLLLIALAAGTRQFLDLRAQHEAAKTETRAHWLQQGKKNPHSAAHYGVYAFKPKTALSLLDQGVDPYTGVAAWLEAHKQNDFRYKPAQDANTLARFGNLSGAIILQALIPLVIILLGFSAFAGEREQGTLRQLLSLGVPPTQLAWGKALGVGVSLAMIAVPAALLGSAALVFAGSNGDYGAAWPRFAGMAASYVLYFVTFIALSLAVSAWMKTARGALVLLLGFWVVNALLSPRVAASLSQRAIPAPGAFQFARNIELDLARHSDGHDAGKHTAKLLAGTLQKYQVTKVEDLPVSFVGIRLQDGEAQGNQAYDARYGELWNQYERQGRLQEALGVVAPFLAIRSASMGFAGTDFSQHRHFAAAAEQYRRYFIDVINQDIIQRAGNQGVYLRGQDLWSQIRDFEYELPGAGWVAQQRALSLAVLAGWTLASLGLLLLATRRLRLE
ncbi:MAG: DUF3526 domain-containing protein [Bryobacteraceae bacterium]|nr:DUF3526 domain-containing protein [Bryobacteraceae bacterium]